eukprot:1026619-Amphidinium_carterae.1
MASLLPVRWNSRRMRRSLQQHARCLLRSDAPVLLGRSLRVHLSDLGVDEDQFVGRLTGSNPRWGNTLDVLVTAHLWQTRFQMLDLDDPCRHLMLDTGGAESPLILGYSKHHFVALKTAQPCTRQETGACRAHQLLQGGCVSSVSTRFAVTPLMCTQVQSQARIGAGWRAPSLTASSLPRSMCTQTVATTSMCTQVQNRTSAGRRSTWLTGSSLPFSMCTQAHDPVAMVIGGGKRVRAEVDTQTASAGVEVQTTVIYHGSFAPFHAGHVACLRSAVALLQQHQVSIKKAVIGFTAEDQVLTKHAERHFANEKFRAKVIAEVLAESEGFPCPVVLDECARRSGFALAAARADSELEKVPSDNTIVVTRRSADLRSREWFQRDKLSGKCVQRQSLNVSSTKIRDAILS